MLLLSLLFLIFHRAGLVSDTLVGAQSRKLYFILVTELELESSFPPTKSPLSIMPHMLSICAQRWFFKALEAAHRSVDHCSSFPFTLLYVTKHKFTNLNVLLYECWNDKEAKGKEKKF